MVNGKGYSVRSSNLKQLGFTSYREYLSSATWSKIRAKAFERTRTCLACGGWAECVHHLEYDILTLSGLREDTLIPLCAICHESIEIGENGEKRSLKAANSRLRMLIRSRSPRAMDAKNELSRSQKRRARKRAKKEYKKQVLELRYATMREYYKSDEYLKNKAAGIDAIFPIDPAVKKRAMRQSDKSEPVPF